MTKWAVVEYAIHFLEIRYRTVLEIDLGLLQAFSELRSVFVQIIKVVLDGR